MFDWDELCRLMAEYPSAVLSTVDETGFPVSVRCRPVPDRDVGGLQVQVPGELPVRPGPASLLWHKHDAELWHQRSFLVRGRLAQIDGVWWVMPNRLVPGIGYGGIRGTIRFARDARRTAGRYLAARNLPRPSVPWDEINAVKKDALGKRRGRRR